MELPRGIRHSQEDQSPAGLPGDQEQSVPTPALPRPARDLAEGIVLLGKGIVISTPVL